jgi:hypothetical protein
MALTPEDLDVLGGFLDKKLTAFKSDLENADQEKTLKDRDATVGLPDVDPDAGPEFYVHLADGSVVTTRDSASTHLSGSDGVPVAVIGRYQKGVLSQ